MGVDDGVVVAVPEEHVLLEGREVALGRRCVGAMGFGWFVIGPRSFRRS